MAIYTNWQKITANRFFYILYIYIEWQKIMANRLKFIHTIIDNYRCKIE